MDRINVLSSGFLLLVLFISSSSSNLKFASWGSPCRMPDNNSGDLVDPKYECDTGIGLICERYTQGLHCGCPTKGALTYDQVSRECRRRVSAQCRPLSTTDPSYPKLSFNNKCHENAECAVYNGTAVSGKMSEMERERLSKPMCLCKEGFIATSDLSECVNPNTGHLAQASFLLLPLSLLFYYLTISSL